MRKKAKSPVTKKILIALAAVVVMALTALVTYGIIRKQQERQAMPVMKKTQVVTPVPVTTYTPDPSKQQAVAPPTQTSGNDGQAPPPMQSPEAREGNVNADTQTGSIKVCIDAGHGLTQRSGKEAVAPGTSEKKAAHVSGAEGKNITEEEFNLSVALKLQEILTAEGYLVTMTRTGHMCDLSNIDRAELGNESDFVVRIHADGSDSSSANGISVLIPEKSYYEDNTMVSESKRLGELILENTVRTTGAKNRGTAVRGDMTGFNWSKVPVALIECGFLSNTEEEKKLASGDYQQKLAEGIARGIRAYCGQ